jgi:hypothetical protein
LSYEKREWHPDPKKPRQRYETSLGVGHATVVLCKGRYILSCQGEVFPFTEGLLTGASFNRYAPGSMPTVDPVKNFSKTLKFSKLIVEYSLWASKGDEE